MQENLQASCACMREGAGEREGKAKQTQAPGVPLGKYVPLASRPSGAGNQSAKSRAHGWKCNSAAHNVTLAIRESHDSQPGQCCPQTMQDKIWRHFGCDDGDDGGGGEGRSLHSGSSGWDFAKYTG